VRNGAEKINIYEFESRSQLIRILSHELGHAIGLGHNENAESIMYYLNKGTGLSPTAEDIRDLKAYCKIK
jgi:predicted Zn-dependent protease